MITIYHLGRSQSDRVVWLMEELQLPYELKWYHRGADQLAPPEYRALHPMGTAPIITDDDVVVAESAAITEYIAQRYGGGSLSVDAAESHYPHYLFWMQFNNNFQSALFMSMAYAAGGGDRADDNTITRLFSRRQEGLYRCLELRLGESEYLGADRFTCADIVSLFNLTSLEVLGARPIDDKLPNTRAYVQRITARPAYRKAMAIAGPAATSPGMA